MSISNRIKEERERIKITQAHLAKEVGKTLRTVGGWESGNTFPNAEDLRVFDHLGMDIQYIITGRKLHSEINHTSNCEYIYIPVYDVEVSAGFGKEAVEIPCQKKHAFRKRWLDFHGYDVDSLIIVRSAGDSMYPLIGDGEYLVVNKKKNMPVNGKIYVIRVRNELKVKFIETRLNGDLVLRSANTFYSDEILTPEMLASEDIAVIGEVVHGARDF
ncbi:S24 family peptidase [Ignatzschineria cameli]|uniref:XRE family transcriptional regulator n=1 Tax=Ignatzschineria cameli TaxID=2182793 RepID=A0ABX5L0S8_9GAMM|nr:S24 family peptidase [Ignatzschineria cameli]PWD90364.1 XRE family transcriptional regulator [Ignatzschineria cameli]PWD92247.1 XRE family transcriptional regulator [Ignatzschineria cameli]PWD93041.1 XRE family transcriptional regulator [Ignatzschineria cameli]